MLCECCRQAPAIYAAVPKRDRYADTEPEPVALCHDCLRMQKTIEGRISSFRPISETADPHRWGM